MKLVPFALAALLVGCATTIHDERASLLAEPVNCEAAEADIAALEAAMPSRGERALSAVQTVTPIGAVSGIATGSYRDRASVLSGRTQRELNARIEEIETACGISREDVAVTE